MTDYYTVIARAVLALSNNTAEARQILYERARAALIASLTAQRPPIPDSDMERERLALEESIQRVEDEALLRHTRESQTTNAPVQSTTELMGAMGVAQKEDFSFTSKDGAQAPSSVDATGTKERRLLMTFRNLDIVLFRLSCSLSVALAALILATGDSWLPTRTFNYFAFVVSVALILCALDMLPRRRSNRTNAISLYLLLISSYLFALTTWFLGLLITFHYWGWVGLLLGLCLGLVGVVPLAMIASGLKSDWVMMVVTVLGILVTYGARDLARERAMEES